MMIPTRKQYGTVAGPHPRTVQVGMNILKDGGNAIDAAIAAAFAEGVVEPSQNGIAGYGGCMVIYLAERQEITTVDYNTVAPMASSDQMFPIKKADSPAGYYIPGRPNVHGPLSVGVPGVVAGLCLALQEFGRLPLDKILQPAIQSARYGFVPNRSNLNGIANNADRWKRDFPETARVYLKNNVPPKPNQKLTNPELARTLETIAADGAPAFYQGEIAQKIVNYIQETGGCLILEDFHQYRAKIMEPYQIQYRDYQLSTPPLGAGGLTTLQMLRLIENYDISQMPVAQRFHLLAEAMKTCWPVRLKRFGDPLFTGIDPSTELGDQFISDLKSNFENGLKSPQPGKIVAYEPISCTSHISTADINGNLVALTQTHGGGFGSMVTVPGTGLLLGHGIGRFDPRPRLANSIAPRKSPLHNMSPIIALRDGLPFATYGIPGGRTIANNQLNLTVNLIDLNMTMQEALDAPRLHSEGAEPIQIEDIDKSTLAEFQRLGHQTQHSSGIGGPGHGVVVADDPAIQSGGTDPRGQGHVMSS